MSARNHPAPTGVTEPGEQPPGADTPATAQHPAHPAHPASARPLPALTGLTLLCLPFAVVGEAGLLLPLESGPVTRILAGCSVAFDLALVLCGVLLAWRTVPGRRGFWRLGVWPLLAGSALISAAALALATGRPTVLVSALVMPGRILAGLATGTLAVYWLRAHTGSVRPPAHHPLARERARTSRAAPLLALTGLAFCAARTDVLTSAYLLPVHLLSAWLVVALIRAPHSPLTRVLHRLGRACGNRPRPLPAEGPLRRRITLPPPGTGAVRFGEQPDIMPNADDENPGAESEVIDVPTRKTPKPGSRTQVSRTGRTIHLDEIPAELRLRPLPPRAEPAARTDPRNSE
ncbi:hypothetical protein KIH74_12250 [Kineosporia sp. J2-2]|uniref:Uncharacterized protein n=1 Tax=Kineosporia corallincola TaxID=2835133 RepID=A0ABS5TF36_9ACTN|nr:hypothetical protein [Kineosporia corallincola]MBT0769700.1 hypothetical protein [Kineosporia corallincola]